MPEERGGYGLDLLWNDDFHHAARVALTGRTEAYYSGYRGTPQEFISASKYGYLYQGQFYVWQGKRRGEPAFGLDPARFVNYIQNHDQVANSARGERLDRLAAPGRYRAMTALLLLAPGTPMLFQGQEFAASAPFVYFADHRPELASRSLRAGRILWRSSPAWLWRSRRPTCSTRAIPPPSSAASWISPSAKSTPRPMPSTAICSSCAGRTRCFVHRLAWMAPCSVRKRSCCASSAKRERTGCSSSIWERNCT